MSTNQDKRHFAHALLALAFASSAMACEVRGNQRSPNFPEGARAPAPTVATNRVQCGSRFGNGEGLAQFDILYGAKIPQKRATLPPEAVAMLCATMGKPGLNVSGTSEWRPSQALAVVLQNVATYYQAKSVFVPVIVPYEECANDSATLKDAKGNTVGSVETNRETCGPAPRMDLRAFLFDAEGAILWKSWSIADRTSTHDLEDATARVLAAIPAEFHDADATNAGVTAPVAAPAAAPATSAAAAVTSLTAGSITPTPDDAAAIEALVAPLNGTCRVAARQLCEASSRAGEGRGACKAHVKTMKALSAAPPHEAAVACARVLTAR